MKIRFVFFTVALLVVAQSAEAQSIVAVGTLLDGLNTICEPWLKGEARATMAARLANAGWGNTLNVIFFKDGPWGHFQAAAQNPDTGRSCTATISIKETPWSNKEVRDAANDWAYVNVGGANVEKPVELNGQTVDAALWQNESGRTLTISQYRTKQEHNDLEIVVTQSKP